MIGIQVKAQIARYIGAIARPGSVVAIVFLAAGIACSGARPKPAPAPPAQPAPQAGAERWSDVALLLPKESPAVFVGRLDEVLEAAEALKAWVVAEPAMLGEDGEETARQIDAGWLAAKGYLGVDPFNPRAWAERGVDPTRPTYGALYPIAADSERFIASVDATLREELGVAPQGSVGPSLRALTETTDELPEGTNARILRAVEETDPIGGVRVVIPITSAREFMLTVTSFAEGMGLVPIPPDVMDEPPAPETRAFRFADGGPAMYVAIDGSHAVLDLVSETLVGTSPNLDEPSEPADDWKVLERAISEVERGRPLAPAPADPASVALTFDQRAMSDFVRLRGYRESLEIIHSTSADRRDAVLLEGLLRADAEAATWAVASDELTGTSFEVQVGVSSPDAIGRVSMTLFADRKLDRLEAQSGEPTLDVHEHSAGFGVALAALRESAWLAWFTDDTAGELDGLEFGDVDPIRIALPIARLTAIAGSNFGDVEGLRVLSPLLADTIVEFEAVRRMEFVGLSADMSDFRTNPRLLAAFVLEEDANIDQSVQVLQAAVVGLLSGWLELPSKPLPHQPVGEPGETTQFAIDGLGAIQQHVTKTDPPVVVFGVGVETAEFIDEIAPLKTERTSPDILEARLEPVALLSWLRAGDPAVFDPIDAEILAQRLGPLVLGYETRRVGKSEVVTLDVTLEAPPRL